MLKNTAGYFHFKFIFIQKRQTILRFGLYFRSYAAVCKNTIFRILAFFLWIQSSTVQLARQQEEWESTKCTRSDTGNGHRSINSRDANTNKGTNAIAFLVFLSYFSIPLVATALVIGIKLLFVHREKENRNYFPRVSWFFFFLSMLNFWHWSEVSYGKGTRFWTFTHTEQSVKIVLSCFSWAGT